MLPAGQGGLRVHSRSVPLVTLGTGLEAGSQLEALEYSRDLSQGHGMVGRRTHTRNVPGLKSQVIDDGGEGNQHVEHLR